MIQDEAVHSGNMLDDARQKIQELASEAHTTATEQVETRLASGMKGAAGTLGSVAESLRTSGQQLREKDQSGVSRYADRAADKIEELSHFLESADAGDVVARVESFARREPAMFIGGAIAIGFLGARFLKSSRRDRQQGTSSRPQFSSSMPASYGNAGSRAGSTGANQFDRDVTNPSHKDWRAAGDGEPSGEKSPSLDDHSGSNEGTSRFGTANPRY